MNRQLLISIVVNKIATRLFSSLIKSFYNQKIRKDKNFKKHTYKNNCLNKFNTKSEIAALCG